MKLIVLDTETSDLDPAKGAQVLELAWIELEHTGQIWEKVSSFNYYIEFSGAISPHAHAVHHIDLRKLTLAGGAHDRATAIKFFLDRIQHDSILVAHNIDFDSKFFPQVTRPWICTYRAAKHVWPNAPGYSNQVLRYWLGLDILKLDPIVSSYYPHQAYYDVITTTGILLKMLETFTPEQLLNFTTSPVKLKKIAFGKHRGMEFNQIPRDYLQWLRKKDDLDDDLKHTIDSVLKP